VDQASGLKRHHTDQILPADRETLEQEDFGHSRLQERQEKGRVILKGQSNRGLAGYLAQVTIGTPAQNFELMIATAHADL
jgi:hypothetical protein